MQTDNSNNRLTTSSDVPAWASWLGIITIVFGIFLTASHGNEILRQVVLAPDTAAVQDKPLKCPEDELVEEGISMAECKLMGTFVKSMIVSRPDWFRSFQTGLMTVGTILAIGSIVVGIALVDYRKWAPTVAVVAFGMLLTVDVVEFIAVINTGPLLRALYLWNILLWFIIHLMMTVSAFAGRGDNIKDTQTSG